MSALDASSVTSTHNKYAGICMVSHTAMGFGVGCIIGKIVNTSMIKMGRNLAIGALAYEILAFAFEKIAIHKNWTLSKVSYIERCATASFALDFVLAGMAFGKRGTLRKPAFALGAGLGFEILYFASLTRPPLCDDEKKSFKTWLMEKDSLPQKILKKARLA